MRAGLAALLFALLAGCPTMLAGCSTVVAGSPVEPPDRELIVAYFTALNASAAKGAAAELQFLHDTQHPDFLDRRCDLNGVTVQIDPSFATLHIDPDWVPEGAQRPRGAVYVVAVSLSVRKDDQTLGEQIGSERVVVLDGSVYGFMPCLRR
jgi:hypothetical protein